MIKVPDTTNSILKSSDKEDFSDEKKEKVNPFDIANAIENKTEDTLPLQWKSSYPLFFMNTIYSNFNDTIFIANQANSLNNLPDSIRNEAHYAFLYHTIPRGKRYAKWFKKSSDVEDIENIAEYYDVSKRQAEKMIHLHTEDQLKLIKECLYKGGRNGYKESK